MVAFTGKQAIIVLSQNLSQTPAMLTEICPDLACTQTAKELLLSIYFRGKIDRFPWRPISSNDRFCLPRDAQGVSHTASADVLPTKPRSRHADLYHGR